MQSTTGKVLADAMPAKLPDGNPVTFSAVMSLITREQWTRVRVFSISPRQGMLQARPAVAAHIGVTPECLEAYLKAEFVTRAAAGRAAASARRKAEKVRQHEQDADAAQVGAMVPGMVYKNGAGPAVHTPVQATANGRTLAQRAGWITPAGEAAVAKATAKARKASAAQAQPGQAGRPALKFDAAPAGTGGQPGGIIQALRDATILQVRDLTPAEMAKAPAGSHTGLTAEVIGLLGDLKPGRARAMLVADEPAAQKVRQAIMHAAPAMGWPAARAGGYKTWTRPAPAGIELVIQRLM